MASSTAMESAASASAVSATASPTMGPNGDANTNTNTNTNGNPNGNPLAMSVDATAAASTNGDVQMMMTTPSSSMANIEISPPLTPGYSPKEARELIMNFADFLRMLEEKNKEHPLMPVIVKRLEQMGKIIENQNRYMNKWKQNEIDASISEYQQSFKVIQEAQTALEQLELKHAALQVETQQWEERYRTACRQNDALVQENNANKARYQMELMEMKQLAQQVEKDKEQFIQQQVVLTQQSTEFHAKQMEAKQKEIDRLMQLYEKERERHDETRQQLEFDAHQSMQSKDRQNVLLQSQNSALKDQIDELQAANEALKRQLQQQQAQQEEMQQGFSATREELSRNMEKLEQEITLREQVAQREQQIAQEKQETIARLEQMLAEKQNDLNEIQPQLAQLESRNNTLQQENIELLRKVSQVDESHQSHQQERNQLVQEKQSLEQTCHQLESQLREMEHALQSLQGQHQEEIQKHQRRESKSASKVENLQQEIQKWRRTAEQHGQRVQSGEQEHTRLSQTLSEYQRQMHDNLQHVQALQHDMESLRLERDEWKKLCETQRSELDTARSRFEEEKQKFLEEVQRQMVALDAENKDIRDKLKVAHNLSDNKGREAMLLQQRVRELEEIQATHQQQIHELHEIKQRCEELQNERQMMSHQHTEEMERLKMEARLHFEQQEQLSNGSSEWRTALNQLQLEKQTLERQLEQGSMEAQAALEAKERQVEMLLNDNEQLRDKLRDWEAEGEQLKMEIEKQNEMLSSKQRDQDSLLQGMEQMRIQQENPHQQNRHHRRSASATVGGRILRMGPYNDDNDSVSRGTQMDVSMVSHNRGDHPSELIQSLQQEIQRLKEHIGLQEEDLKTQTRNLEDYYAQVLHEAGEEFQKEASEKLNRAKRERLALIEDLKQREQAFNQFADQFKRESEALREEMARKDQQLKAMHENAGAEINREVRELRERMLKENADKGNLIEKLTAEKDQLSQRMETIRMELEHSRNQLELLSQAKDDLAKQKDELTKQKMKLESELQFHQLETEQVHSRRESLMEQKESLLKRLQQEQESVTNELATQRDQNQRLRAQMESMQTSFAQERFKLVEQVSNLELTIKKQQSSLDQLQIDYESAKNHLERSQTKLETDSMSKQSELQRLEERVSELQQEKADLLANLDQQKQQWMERIDKLEVEAQETTQLTRALEEMKAEREVLQDQLKQTRRNLDDLSAKYEDMADVKGRRALAQYDALVAQNHELEMQLVQQKKQQIQELTRKELELQDLRSTNEKLTAELCRVQQNHEVEKEEAIGRLEKQVELLKANNRSSLGSLAMELHEAQKMLTGEKQTRQEWERLMQEKNQEIDRLNDQTRQLEAAKRKATIDQNELRELESKYHEALTQQRGLYKQIATFQHENEGWKRLLVRVMKKMDVQVDGQANHLEFSAVMVSLCSKIDQKNALVEELQREIIQLKRELATSPSCSEDSMQYHRLEEMQRLQHQQKHLMAESEKQWKLQHRTLQDALRGSRVEQDKVAGHNQHLVQVLAERDRQLKEAQANAELLSCQLSELEAENAKLKAQQRTQRSKSDFVGLHDEVQDLADQLLQRKERPRSAKAVANGKASVVRALDDPPHGTGGVDSRTVVADLLDELATDASTRSRLQRLQAMINDKECKLMQLNDHVTALMRSSAKLQHENEYYKLRLRALTRSKTTTK